MDVSYLNAFIKATRDVFATMVHVPLTFSKPRLKANDERLHKLYKVSAVISLAGPVAGQVVLTLSEDVAIALASGMSGEKLVALDDNCLDALAEIINMIAGNAKKELSSDAVMLTIPRLARPQDVQHEKGAPVIVIPFDTPHGRFLIEVSVGAAKSKAARAKAMVAAGAAPSQRPTSAP
jgi:chemotaxis protein CheX